MTTLATIGHGVKFQRETTTPGTYEDVGEILTLGDVDMTREAIDVTTHDSPGGFKQYIPGGFIDMSDVPCEVHFLNNAFQQAVRADFENAVKKKWRIIFPLTPAVTVSFESYVFGYKVSTGDASTAVKATFTVKPVTKPVWS